MNTNVNIYMYTTGLMTNFKLYLFKITLLGNGNCQIHFI